jgi:hypothetical protein
MEENEKNEPVKPEEEGLMDKAKRLIGKADEFIEENVEKVVQSKAFESVAETLDKAGDFVEDKIEDIKKTDLKEKLGTFADEAGK